MLPRERRLKKETEIKRLIEKGKGVFDEYCRLKFIRGGPTTRFVFVAGLSVSKSAVKRNRLKRQVRAIILRHLKEIVPNHDIALLLRSSAVGKSSKELEQHILSVLKKAGLMI